MAAVPQLFNAAALTAFWEDNGAMALSNRTRVQLDNEGITIPEDLDEYDDEGMEKIFSNLAKPPKTALPNGRLRETEPYRMTGKSKMRILGAAKLVKFYKTISRPLDPSSMTWTVIKNFLEQHQALKERKSRSSDDTSIPKITKTLPVYNWIQSLNNYLNRRVGVRNAGLSYVVREVAAVSVIVPARALDEPHSEEYGSIEGDQTHRLSHTHALFKVNNAEVFDIIEQGVRGSDIAPTIALYRKRRDGRGALKAIIDQHAGVRVWDDMVRSAKEVMGGSRKWTGTTAFTISQHCQVHRKAFIALQEASDHVPVQIPDERTRVTNLMDSFETVDPTVLAALSSVRQDELAKRVNFEAAVSFLIQSCPVVAKQKKKGVTFSANVAAVDTAGTPPGKPMMGTTGVQLRYYKKEDFGKLTAPQRKEVSAWTKANPNPGYTKGAKKKEGGPANTKAAKKWKSEVSAMTARNDEMLAAMVESQQANLEAMQASAASSGKPAPSGTISSAHGLAEETIRANERARLSLLRLQAIQKGAAKPAGTPPVFGPP